MTNRNLLTALVAANSILACNSIHAAPVTKLEYETGWIRFTEEVPEPKPVISLPKPEARITSLSQSASLPVPTLQATNSNVALPVPEKTGVVAASGKDVPLLQAMHAIVPSVWRIRLSPAVASGFKGTVSWKAGEQWPKVLNDMLTAKGMHAEFADQDREIKVIYVSNEKVKTPSPALLTLNAPTPAAAVQPEHKNWIIEKGSTLKDGFISWTKTANCPGKDHKWIVQWKTDINYPIDYPLTFKGNFEEATTKLFTLYQKAQSPLYVSAYRNQCIIIIDDRK